MNTFWVHKNWKWKKENATAKYIDEHCEEAVTLTDAQATVEALRDERDRLRQFTKVICGHCCEPMAIPSKAILQSQLSALQRLVRVYFTEEGQYHDDAMKTLRDERDRLITEYVRLVRLCEPIAKMLSELIILTIGCSREQELAWKMAVKNFRHYQRDYAADVLLQAALTPVGGEGRMSEIPRFDNDIEQLKSFYDVTNEHDLIVAMDKHIVRLQNKIRQLLPPEPAVRQVR